MTRPLRMTRCFEKLSTMMARRFKLFNNRIFRNRNIIVVSQGEVKHYPISSKVQLFGLCTMMGLLSWASYSTGSYFSARDVLAEKDRTLKQTVQTNRRIGEQFDLLRRDLAKLDGKDIESLSEYDRFVLAQHKEAAELDTAVPTADGANNPLQERISYLEEMVEQMKNDRQLLIASIQTRSEGLSDSYKDIIEATGLDLARLAKQPQAKTKLAALQKAMPARNTTTASASPQAEGDFSAQGGPFVPANPSQLTQEELDAEANMFNTLNNVLLLRDITAVMPLATPVAKGYISSHFGRRIDPINKSWAVHNGVDFVDSYGSKVLSTANGVVTMAGTMRGYGNIVEIDHGYGLTTRYAHLKKALVSEGEVVQKGTAIGVQGNSGRSTGSHVHYEVRFNEMALNPEKFIKAGNNVF